LQRYTIEQITLKVNELHRLNAEYQERYGTDYPAFSQHIANDEKYVQYIEANVSKTWEVVLADWEFSYKGIKDLTRILQDILIK
jgi:hypothetical protein